MEILSTTLPGCYRIAPKAIFDNRGWFVKVLHQTIFAEHGLISCFAEEYYSVSKRGVLRGLHFQVPPAEHVKLVYCVKGAVADAVVDLRRGSPTYGKHELFELDQDNSNALYIPAGFAHGFYARTDDAIMLYKVTSVYSPQYDKGILWSSAEIAWPDTNLLISERDRAFPTLANFESPFVYIPG